MSDLIALLKTGGLSRSWGFSLERGIASGSPMDEGDPGYRPKAGRRRVDDHEVEGGQQPATRKGWGDDDGHGSFSPPVMEAPERSANFSPDDEEEITEVEGSKPPVKEEEPAAIPQLEAEAEEDISKEVADAPKNYESVKVPQLADLEKESQLPLPSNWEDIDVSILTSVLTRVDEEDIEWEPQSLFSQLASEIQLERDTQNPEEKSPEK